MCLPLDSCAKRAREAGLERAWTLNTQPVNVFHFLRNDALTPKRGVDVILGRGLLLGRGEHPQGRGKAIKDLWFQGGTPHKE